MALMWCGRCFEMIETPFAECPVCDAMLMTEKPEEPIEEPKELGDKAKAAPTKGKKK